jgi:hypothetical protein
MVEFLNLRRDSVLILIGKINNAHDDAAELNKVQQLLRKMTAWTEIVVVAPTSEAHAKASISRHFSNRNQTAFLRLFYIGHSDEETGALLFNDGQVDPEFIAECYNARQYKPPLEIMLSDSSLHNSWERLAADNFKVFSAAGEVSIWEDAVEILKQKKSKFEQFVQRVWPEASLVKWRWDISCEEGEEVEDDAAEEVVEGHPTPDWAGRLTLAWAIASTALCIYLLAKREK